MVVSGFLIAKAELPALDNAVIRVKNSLDLGETDPVKWNMRKCHKSLKKLGKDQIHELRKRMVSLADELPIQILMSLVWMGNPFNKVSAWKWSF